MNVGRFAGQVGKQSKICIDDTPWMLVAHLAWHKTSEQTYFTSRHANGSRSFACTVTPAFGSQVHHAQAVQPVREPTIGNKGSTIREIDGRNVPVLPIVLIFTCRLRGTQELTTTNCGYTSLVLVGELDELHNFILTIG